MCVVHMVLVTVFHSLSIYKRDEKYKQSKNKRNEGKEGLQQIPNKTL